MDNWLILLIFIVASVASASTGALFPPGQWYKTLDKPSWTPPDWLFAPAWTLFYALLAYAGYTFATSAQGGEWLFPLVIFGLHLIFNGAWSALFFGIKRIDLALVDAILMFLTLILTIILFMPVSSLAGWLLVPYLFWVGFASALNYSMLRRNGSAPKPA
ncbi:MAG: TspO/MBR family protein [Pseudomonadota bacterium]